MKDEALRLRGAVMDRLVAGLLMAGWGRSEQVKVPPPHLLFGLPTSPFSLPALQSFSLSWQSCRRKPSLGPISLLCLTVATARRASILWRSMRYAMTMVGERLKPSLQWTYTFPAGTAFRLIRGSRGNLKRWIRKQW